jgi:hypothetical protein
MNSLTSTLESKRFCYLEQLLPEKGHTVIQIHLYLTLVLTALLMRKCLLTHITYITLA